MAVLVSPGGGAGWSTWFAGPASLGAWCLFAPEVVAWVEAGKPGGLALLRELVDAHPSAGAMYCGGGMDLEIQWLPIGTKFRVTEYSGSEGIELADEIEWYIASADPVQATDGKDTP